MSDDELLAIVRAVAETEPVVDTGGAYDSSIVCVFCVGHDRGGALDVYKPSDLVHENDCAWLRACAVIKERGE